MSFLRGRAPEFDLAEALVAYAYRIPQTPSMDDMDEEGERFVYGTTEVLRVVDDPAGEALRPAAVHGARLDCVVSRYRIEPRAMPQYAACSKALRTWIASRFLAEFWNPHPENFYFQPGDAGNKQIYTWGNHGVARRHNVGFCDGHASPIRYEGLEGVFQSARDAGQK